VRREAGNDEAPLRAHPPALRTRDGGAVLLTGRTGIFSAGFDLKVFPLRHAATVAMLGIKATLAQRIPSSGNRFWNLF